MVRSFLSDPLPAEVVERILANAQRAPSAGFSQGWAFLTLEGALQTQRYWRAVGPEDRETFGWPDLFQAPLLIVCLSHKDAYLDRYAEPDTGWTDRSESHWPAPYWDIDAGMAALLILLAAADAGLGAVFFRVPPDRLALLRQPSGVPAGPPPTGTVAAGHPKPGDRPAPSLRRGYRPVDDVIHRGHW